MKASKSTGRTAHTWCIRRVPSTLPALPYIIMHIPPFHVHYSLSHTRNRLLFPDLPAIKPLHTPFSGRMGGGPRRSATQAKSNADAQHMEKHKAPAATKPSWYQTPFFFFFAQQCPAFTKMLGHPSLQLPEVLRIVTTSGNIRELLLLL